MVYQKKIFSMYMESKADIYKIKRLTRLTTETETATSLYLSIR